MGAWESDAIGGTDLEVGRDSGKEETRIHQRPEYVLLLYGQGELLGHPVVLTSKPAE
jgi:hypothetical protein